jgi:hypothetical protein
MIDISKNRKAIEAIHNLLIELKIQIGNDSSKIDLMDLIDEIEYLPALMLQENTDTTQTFNDYLLSICEKYGYLRIMRKFEQD